MTRGLRGAISIAVAHAVNDSYAYILPALFPVLLPQAGLTLAAGALLVAIQQVAASFLQPLFGHWSDRSGGGRWMAWAGVLLAGIGAGSLGLAPGFAGLTVAMLATGIGTALFHPVSAALIAQAAPPARRAFWMSAYISAGNLGLGIGPLMVGLVLAEAGLRQTWLLAVPALLASALVWRVAPARPGRAGGTGAPIGSVLRQHWRLLTVLISVVGLRSWASSTLVTFLPVLSVLRHATPTEGAHALTLFLVAGATGGLLGGAAADRLGRDRVVVGSLLLSIPFGVLVATLDQFGPLFLVSALASGFFLNGSWVSLTVRAQESVPGSLAMMSGLMLGLSIGLGGLAVTPVGLLAEHFGLPPVLVVTSCLPFLAAILMRALPAPRTDPVASAPVATHRPVHPAVPGPPR